MRGWVNKYKYGKSTNSKNGTDVTDNDYEFNNDEIFNNNKWFENIDGFDNAGKDKKNENKMHITNYCNNCGKYGHLFSNCVVPITSIGVIVCRKKIHGSNEVFDFFEEYGVVDCTTSPSTTSSSASLKNEFEYLMIQRIDTFGYIEFMRGKYSIHNYQFLKNIIDEMTIQEKQNILTNSFDELWVSLWGDYSGLHYRGEKQLSKNKYLQLKSGVNNGSMQYDLQSLIASSTTQWETAEWGFPKGRRNHQEKDIDCAFREFTEETGYSKDCLKQIFNVLPYEEIFIGSNLKCYKNKYFLSYMSSNVHNTCGYQKSEVKNMKWLTYDECMQIIRPYNIEKKNMLTSINKTLRTFYICNI
jgi:hypothetical protein